MNNKLISNIMVIAFIIVALILIATVSASSSIWTPMETGMTNHGPVKAVPRMIYGIGK
jgi:hypothetical protein